MLRFRLDIHAEDVRTAKRHRPAPGTNELKSSSRRSRNVVQFREALKGEAKYHLALDIREEAGTTFTKPH